MWPSHAKSQRARMVLPASPLVLLESALAHEAAHQWFYSVVGNDQSDEPWLDETIVQYVTGLHHLDVDGERAAQDWFDYSYHRWGYADQAEIPKPGRARAKIALTTKDTRDTKKPQTRAPAPRGARATPPPAVVRARYRSPQLVGGFASGPNEFGTPVRHPRTLPPDL